MFRNLTVKFKGKRYDSTMESFFMVLLIWGGPRVAQFAAYNLNGPSVRTMERWISSESNQLELGLTAKNFQWLASIYTKFKKSLNIDFPVPCLCAEDETRCQYGWGWQNSTDSLIGSCGLHCQNKCETVAQCRKRNECPKVHQCKVDVSILVGNNENSYRVFSDYHLGSYCRVILINPLFEGLPVLVCLFASTCGAFDHCYVRDQ